MPKLICLSSARAPRLLAASASMGSERLRVSLLVGPKVLSISFEIGDVVHLTAEGVERYGGSSDPSAWTTREWGAPADRRYEVMKVGERGVVEMRLLHDGTPYRRTKATGHKGVEEWFTISERFLVRA